jgi:hypothetical protein
VLCGAGCQPAADCQSASCGAANLGCSRLSAGSLRLGTRWFLPPETLPSGIVCRSCERDMFHCPSGAIPANRACSPRSVNKHPFSIRSGQGRHSRQYRWRGAAEGAGVWQQVYNDRFTALRSIRLCRAFSGRHAELRGTPRLPCRMPRADGPQFARVRIFQRRRSGLRHRRHRQHRGIQSTSRWQAFPHVHREVAVRYLDARRLRSGGAEDMAGLLVAPVNGHSVDGPVSVLFLLELLGDFLYFSPNSKQIATPQLSDLFFRVAAPNQFQCDIECFRRAVPAVDSTATIEV